jgi:hypothetical protein
VLLEDMDDAGALDVWISEEGGGCATEEDKWTSDDTDAVVVLEAWTSDDDEVWIGDEECTSDATDAAGVLDMWISVDDETWMDEEE